MKTLNIGLVCTTLLASAALANDNIVIDGSTTLGPIAKAFAEYYRGANPSVNITISESGSGNGVKSLLNGTCDVAPISRPLTSSEFTAAASNEKQPIAHVVALDGVSMLVHPSNPVQDLTVEQVRKIYLGEYTNWKLVGGPDKEIITISRDNNSGTFETFQMKVMNGANVRSDCEVVNSNGAARQRVQNTTGAVAYVGIGFVDSSVKALRINGVHASVETVKSGQYPIARPLYMYTNGYPAFGSHLYHYMTLHFSRDGQQIISEIGFIPLTEY